MAQATIIRNIVSVVRCPAMAGVGVPIQVCQGNDKIKPCPYMMNLWSDTKPGSFPSIMTCTYNPDSPKKVLDPETRKPYTNRRESPYLGPEQRAQADQIFSLQVPADTDAGPEWQNARMNMLGK
jgi:hypothetical protein